MLMYTCCLYHIPLKVVAPISIQLASSPNNDLILNKINYHPRQTNANTNSLKQPTCSDVWMNISCFKGIALGPSHQGTGQHNQNIVSLNATSEVRCSPYIHANKLILLPGLFVNGLNPTMCRLYWQTSESRLTSKYCLTHYQCQMSEHILVLTKVPHNHLVWCLHTCRHTLISLAWAWSSRPNIVGGKEI